MNIPGVFSSSVIDSAFKVGQEFAWRRADALAAVGDLESARLGILGGELWLVREGDVYPCLSLPTMDDKPATVGWTSSWRQTDETWVEFVLRAASEARAAIRTRPESDELAPLPESIVYYNLSYWSQAEYLGAA